MDMVFEAIDIFGRPSFFKVLLGNFSHKLRIPPAFLKHIQHDISIRAILKGPVGGLQYVKISREGIDMYFQDGWEIFADHHKLQEHDFLVFTYLGGQRFYMHVFDKTACEVEYRNSTRIFDGSVVIKEKLKGVQPGKCKPATQHGGCTGEGTSSFPEQKNCKPVQEHPCPSGKPGGGIVMERKRKRDRPQALHSVPYSSTAQGTVSTSYRAKTNTESQREKASNRSQRTRTFFVSRRRPVTEADRAKAWNMAKSFNSDSPYAMIQLVPSAVYSAFILHLPQDFLGSHHPRHKAQVILQDPNGKSWEVTYIGNNKGNRDTISAGWRAFSLANNLEEGDICIFERVESLKVGVHFYRLVKEITPLIQGNI